MQSIGFGSDSATYRQPYSEVGLFAQVLPERIFESRFIRDLMHTRNVGFERRFPPSCFPEVVAQTMFPVLSSSGRDRDLADELARNLPRWVGWIPVVGKAGHRRWIRWKDAHRIENQIVLHPGDVRIQIPTRDQGSIDFAILVSNFSGQRIEADRVELHHMSISGRSLQRRSEMLKIHGIVQPHRTEMLRFLVDLQGGDVRQAIEGIGRASNPWCTPQATTNIYADIVFLAGRERFRKNLHYSLNPVDCNVTGGVPESLTVT